MIAPNNFRIRFQPIFLTGLLTAMLVSANAIVPSSSLGDESSGRSSADANPLVVTMQLDKSEALIAERIQLQIIASAPQGVTVQFPELSDQLGEFEIVATKDIPDVPAGADRKWIRKVALETLITGELEIPSMEIGYVDRRTATALNGVQITPPQPVLIRSTLEGAEDPTQFREIKSVVFLPESQPGNVRWLVWAAGMAGLVALVAIAVTVVSRKPGRSPKQTAIKSLQGLKESPALVDGDVEQFYIRLVGILRAFVQEQFEISAPRLTTSEFMAAMGAETRLSDDFRSELRELLSLADMVKFAGWRPADTRLDEVVDQAMRLVENADVAPHRVPAHRDTPIGEDR